MSRIIIGTYAHVDGGKTTLSEAILHRCNVLRKSGRVDHEDSFLDFNSYERRKGITVYTKEACFSYKGKDYVYVDTPGHLDFVGEVNRTFQILDLAILIIDAWRQTGDILTAATVKFRPVLMSCAAALVGMLPMALGGGLGSELRQSMGIGSVGGILVSTLVSLYFIPALCAGLRPRGR